MNTTSKCKRYSNKDKAHHWLVNSPQGAYSTGVCKYCKATREFKNSMDYSNWQGWSLGNGKYSKPKDKKLSSSKGGAV